MSFLDRILERKRQEVQASRRERGEAELAAAVAELPPPLPFDAALSSSGGSLRIIAEVKRASPSAGAIDPELDAAERARSYERAGAAAVSVATDTQGFGGSLADLAAVRDAVRLPLLRTDFIVDRHQLLEARLFGADAVLLIVAALDEAELVQLLASAAGLGLAAVVEVHDERELEVALAQGARIVGIDNRDLATLEVDLGTSERLLPLVPPAVKAIAASGVRTAADAQRLRRAGAANLLVGEALVRAADPAGLLAAMSSA